MTDATTRRVPEGWRLVPVEPTEEMLRRGMDAFMAAHDLMFCKNEPCGPIYKTMLAAAPTTSDVAGVGSPVTREEIGNKLRELTAWNGTLLYGEAENYILALLARGER